MSFARNVLLLAALSTLVMPATGFADGTSYAMVTKAERSLRGSWYSAGSTITFGRNGTVRIKGKRYFYAVSNGGMIQLSGHNSSNAIPYQLSDGQLTLTVDGITAVYSRKRPDRK